MNRSTHALAIRREALIEQIARERDQVAHACLYARQRLFTVSNQLTQLQTVARNPVFIAAAVACVWMVGWQRSATLLKNVALGWSAWRRVTER
ncbi:MAG: hypothetical protein ACRDAM_10790 [Casimicrobium sp.]